MGAEAAADLGICLAAGVAGTLTGSARAVSDVVGIRIADEVDVSEDDATIADGLFVGTDRV
jgi:hypothetical protein